MRSVNRSALRCPAGAGALPRTAKLVIANIETAEDYFAIELFSFAPIWRPGRDGRVMTAKGVRENNEDTMRIVTHHILPLIVAATTSGLLLSAAIV